MRTLGLDLHPELAGDYFRHYRRVVYLVQRYCAPAVDQAAAIARRLGLEFEFRITGYGELERSLRQVAARTVDVRLGQAPWRR